MQMKNPFKDFKTKRQLKKEIAGLQAQLMQKNILIKQTTIKAEKIMATLGVRDSYISDASAEAILAYRIANEIKTKMKIERTQQLKPDTGEIINKLVASIYIVPWKEEE